VPDFIVRLKTDGPPSYLILETKGFDDLEEVKRAAADALRQNPCQRPHNVAEGCLERLQEEDNTMASDHPARHPNAPAVFACFAAVCSAVCAIILTYIA
jgi:hypothetical protein